MVLSGVTTRRSKTLPSSVVPVQNPVGPPPVITGVTPNPAYPPQLVTITGSNFQSVTGVSFNGSPARFTIVNSSTITAILA